jgi:predicted ATP-dependent endonuclease of OLD family
MIIKQFRIQNYRAIKDTSISLNYRLNPIIGVNESGKTTILQAILCFDKQRDRYNVGKHLKFQNKYSTNRQDDCRTFKRRNKGF